MSDIKYILPIIGIFMLVSTFNVFYVIHKRIKEEMSLQVERLISLKHEQLKLKDEIDKLKEIIK